MDYNLNYDKRLTYKKEEYNMLSLHSIEGFKSISSDELFFINGGYGSSKKTVQIIHTPRPETPSWAHQLKKYTIQKASDIPMPSDTVRPGVPNTAERA